MVSVATGAQWENFADVMGHSEWLENPDCRNVGAHLENRRMPEEEVSTAFAECTSGEWIKRLQTQKCIYGRIGGFKEVARHEQIQVGHMFIEIIVLGGMKMTVPSSPLVVGGEENAGIVVNDTMMCRDCAVD